MARKRIASVVLALSFMLSAVVVPADAATVSPYMGLRRHYTPAHFGAAAKTGVVVEDRSGRAHIRLAASGLGTGSNAALYGTSSRFYYGRVVSPMLAAHPFDRAIPSWNAVTPDRTWVQTELRAYRSADRHWTKYYNLGIWVSGTGTSRRHSVAGQANADGDVATDTLELEGARYSHYQYRLTLFTLDPAISPSVQHLSVVTSDASRELAGLPVASDRQAWGTDLWVPRRSQNEYEGGEGWCSPTSTSMVMAYWGKDVTVPFAAAGMYDSVYEGTGNWPFNTAFAAQYGLEAHVTRMGSLSQVEEWISAGIPVVISLAWAEGELPNAPRPSSGGHIIVIRGFTAGGNVVTNDPAAPTKWQARIEYDRAGLEKVWRKYSGGTVYLIYPKGRAIPTDKRYGSW